MRTILRRLFWGRPDLVVSPERVNRAVLAELRRELAGDIAYRERVKRRMREGRACELPPLYSPGVSSR